eukprot:scaffold374_cov380-Prasinococcus_capsulatus_cf.AAC.9
MLCWPRPAGMNQFQEYCQMPPELLLPNESLTSAGQEQFSTMLTMKLCTQPGMDAVMDVGQHISAQARPSSEGDMETERASILESGIGGSTGQANLQGEDQEMVRYEEQQTRGEDATGSDDNDDDDDDVGLIKDANGAIYDQSGEDHSRTTDYIYDNDAQSTQQVSTLSFPPPSDSHTAPAAATAVVSLASLSYDGIGEDGGNNTEATGDEGDSDEQDKVLEGDIDDSVQVSEPRRCCGHAVLALDSLSVVRAFLCQDWATGSDNIEAERAVASQYLEMHGHSGTGSEEILSGVAHSTLLQPAVKGEDHWSGIHFRMQLQRDELHSMMVRPSSLLRHTGTDPGRERLSTGQLGPVFLLPDGCNGDAYPKHPSSLRSPQEDRTGHHSMVGEDVSSGELHGRKD